MEVGAHELHDRNEVLGGVDQKASEKSRSSVVWSVVETVIVIESEERAHVIRKNEDLEALGSKKTVVEGFQKLNDKEVVEVPRQVEQRTNKNSNNLVDGNVSETLEINNSGEAARVIVDNGKLVAKVEELGSSEVLVEESKKKVAQAEKESYVIDMKSGSSEGFGDRGEKVCRICHLSSDQSPDRKLENTTSYITMDLIDLGCGCKDELGVAHAHCAEVWFKLKGNRTCEICEETAVNVTGNGNNRFMQDWSDAALAAFDHNSSERNGSCWRGQPFCNFLMACLHYVSSRHHLESYDSFCMHHEDLRFRITKAVAILTTYEQIVQLYSDLFQCGA